ncbi:hypothetical protein [Nonomuraea rosea]
MERRQRRDLVIVMVPRLSDGRGFGDQQFVDAAAQRGADGVAVR